MPENNLKIYPNQVSLFGGISEKVFIRVIDEITEIYKPIIKIKGGNLSVTKDWKEPYVNAYSDREGDEWSINFFGGLARHVAVTADGFALIVCHELGHHLGGLPKYKENETIRWASNEGQADYFATTKCLRKYFTAHPKEDIPNIPNMVKVKCDEVWKTDKEYKICVRESMAGQSIGNLFSAIESIPLPKPNFDTPDQSHIATTRDSHSLPQCRLDTFFQGALCPISDKVDFSNLNEWKGSCYISNSRSDLGRRPSCWFNRKYFWSISLF